MRVTTAGRLVGASDLARRSGLVERHVGLFVRRCSPQVGRRAACATGVRRLTRSAATSSVGIGLGGLVRGLIIEVAGLRIITAAARRALPGDGSATSGPIRSVPSGRDSLPQVRAAGRCCWSLLIRSPAAMGSARRRRLPGCSDWTKPADRSTRRRRRCGRESELDPAAGFGATLADVPACPSRELRGSSGELRRPLTSLSGNRAVASAAGGSRSSGLIRLPDRPSLSSNDSSSDESTFEIGSIRGRAGRIEACP